MVSEGVDIPRLRVGVFASNVRTPLYFRQFCGRFVRSNTTNVKLDESYVYIPGNHDLVHNARMIKAEVASARKKKKEIDASQLIAVESAPVERGESRYVAIGASVEQGGSLHGELPKGPPPRATTPVASAEPPRLLADEKLTLRKRINALVQATATQFRVPPGKVHGYLNTRYGASLATASIEQLNSRFMTLKEWQRTGRYEGYR
jgi:superfamily II DNA or RNA helicase